MLEGIKSGKTQKYWEGFGWNWGFGGGFWWDGIMVLLSYPPMEKAIFVFSKAGIRRKQPKLRPFSQELEKINFMLLSIPLKNNSLTHTFPRENMGRQNLLEWELMV